MKLRNLGIAIAFIIACELAGIAGSIFTIPAIGTWYVALHKPWFTPPSFVFGPVWTALYALMGISLYLVWGKRSRKRGATKAAYAAFCIQLALNVLWSILFFGLKSPFYGFIGIIALWFGILATEMRFYRISRKAAYVLLPYLLWVTFAAALNLGILLMN